MDEFDLDGFLESLQEVEDERSMKNVSELSQVAKKTIFNFWKESLSSAHFPNLGASLNKIVKYL